MQSPISDSLSAPDTDLEETDSSTGRELGKDILKALSVAAVFAGAGLALRSRYVQEELFDIDHVRAQLHGLG